MGILKNLFGRISVCASQEGETNWYLASDDLRHTRQVVINLPAKANVPAQVSNLVAGSVLMDTRLKWGIEVLFMDRGERGPFIFAKATGVVERLNNKPGRVALAFYHLTKGGIFQIFVDVDDAPYFQYISERSIWLDDKNWCEVVESIIDRQKIEVCFVAPGKNGPLTGFFGRAVNIQPECSERLKQEWKGLIGYHNCIPVSGRNYQGALNQYNLENPLEKNPILEKRFEVKVSK